MTPAEAPTGERDDDDDGYKKAPEYFYPNYSSAIGNISSRLDEFEAEVDKRLCFIEKLLFEKNKTRDNA